jgi:hypothetical protein
VKAKHLPGLIAGAVVLALAGLFAYSNFRAPAPGNGPGAAAAQQAPAQASAAQPGTGQRPGGGSAPGGAAGAGGGGQGRGPAAIVVDAAPAAVGSLASAVKLTGEIQAARTLKAYPDTAGRVIEVASAGTRVAAGDVVARVDPSRPGSRFEPSPVRAPLAGSVVSVLLENGANATAGTAVVEIATLSDLDVVVNVPERWAPDISVGTAARVALTALPGRSFPARVRTSDPVIDPVSRSKRVLLSLSGDLSRVEPGMFAEVELSVSRSASALLVPLEAVVRRGSSDLVYVVSDGVARERPVRLGRFSETGAEVLDGVAAGEVVVVRGQNLIRDGSRVSVSEGRR